MGGFPTILILIFALVAGKIPLNEVKNPAQPTAIKINLCKIRAFHGGDILALRGAYFLDSFYDFVLSNGEFEFSQVNKVEKLNTETVHLDRWKLAL